MIRNILVPTDFSAGSEAALGRARELAAALGATLHVMHVVESPYAPGAFMEMYVPPPPEYFAGLEREARARLEQWLPAEDKVAFRAVLTTPKGVAAQEILERLDQEPKIDLVVMATHGRSGVARLMMGSVADKVVRGAGCPVVTVKECSNASGGRAA